MTTETQVVKRIVHAIKGRGDSRWGVEYSAKQLLSEGERHSKRSHGNDIFAGESMAITRKLRKRVMKKLRQPNRRKDRGPLRARAAGKDNHTAVQH